MKGPETFYCTRKNRFESVFVCAATCRHKCAEYRRFVSVSMLVEYCEKHPDYELYGEIMLKNEMKKTAGEKVYWVVDDENRVIETQESSITGNPQEYLGKRIYDRPPAEYEIVVALRRKGGK